MLDDVRYIDAVRFQGLLDERQPFSTLTLKSVDVSPIPLGFAVAFADVATSDMDVTLPGNTGARIAAIAVANRRYQGTYVDGCGNPHGILSSAGLVPGAIFVGATAGRVCVPTCKGTRVADRLYIRASTGELTNRGGSGIIDASRRGRWITTPNSDGLAWLEFDLTR